MNIHSPVFFARLLGTLALITLFAANANASPLNAADERAVRATIEAQLAAFAKDDAKKAFSFAAPAIQEAAGNAAGFMEMVRRSYPMVYRPASVAFLKPEGETGDVIQRVQISDASGNSWLAIYTLQRQKDGHWRISGCVVTENKGRMA